MSGQDAGAANRSCLEQENRAGRTDLALGALCMTRIVFFILQFAIALWSGAALAGTITSSTGEITVTTVLRGLKEPWSLAFLPDGSFLVTERGGRLILGEPGRRAQRVGGVPAVAVGGQGGLFDVVVARDFASSREIFLSFAKKQRSGSGTALVVARLSEDGSRLENVRQIFEMLPGTSGGRHFGGRIVEARDGTLFLTLGERGDRPAAQDLGRHNGKIVRIMRDGSVPADNPFLSVPDALPEIWSFGHRNPQGAAQDAKGGLWVSEHGAKGGDEINRVRRGANYGWPVIAYGRHYSGAKIGEGTHKPGMEQPEFYWDPSIAPSGLMIYSGKLWPRWRGHMFIGSLKFHMISRLSPGSWREERLASSETTRVRDVREAPDGSIWFLSVGKGTVFRMAPADGN